MRHLFNYIVNINIRRNNPKANRAVLNILNAIYTFTLLHTIYIFSEVYFTVQF